MIGLESNRRIGYHLHRRFLRTMTKPKDTKRDESIPVAGVVPIEQMMGDDGEDTVLLGQVLQNARKYLEPFHGATRSTANISPEALVESSQFSCSIFRLRARKSLPGCGLSWETSRPRIFR